MIQLFSRCLCLFHCLCIRLCLCICVPYSFLNSYYHKLSENVWVWGSGASRSGGGEDVTIAGQRPTDQPKRKDRATQPLDHGRLRWAKMQKCKPIEILFEQRFDNNSSQIHNSLSYFVSVGKAG